MKSGYDRYLDYQYRRSGGFFKAIFEAIKLADIDNMPKIEAGFPEEVDAYRVWAREGALALALRVTVGYGLLDDLCAEYEIRMCCGMVATSQCKCGQNWSCRKCKMGGGSHPCDCGRKVSNA